MKPLKFPEQNVTYAADQPEYLPLPAHNDGEAVVFCMGLTVRERFKLLFTGKLWCALLMFGKPLTPSFFTVDKHKVITDMEEVEAEQRFNDKHNIRHDCEMGKLGGI